MLKYLVKTWLSDDKCLRLLEIANLATENNVEEIKESFSDYIECNVSESKQAFVFWVVEKIEHIIDIKLFVFSLRLYLIKGLLLAEAKLTNTIIATELQGLHPLSLKYDDISIYRPYAVRVNGALLSLIFFSLLEQWETNFMSKTSEDFLKNIWKELLELEQLWIEANQIFMLMFSESINQSIISDSGSNYENRIFGVLTGLWIPSSTIKKTHDNVDKSTEFDFFFNLDGKSYGISAKRTLRERYKQFIKTSIMSNEIDVMIEITLGLDLNEQKARNILSHWVYIFVSDEIYQSKTFLQKLDWVFSVKDLTIKKLKSL